LRPSFTKTKTGASIIFGSALDIGMHAVAVGENFGNPIAGIGQAFIRRCLQKLRSSAEFLGTKKQ
jgi:hypothetical protein